MILIPQRRTLEELQECLYKNHPDIEILEGEYVNYYSKFLLHHKKCDYIWETTPNSIFKGSGCPKCGNAIKKSHNDFIERMKDINPNIKILGYYERCSKKIECQCLIDGYIWEQYPNNLLRKIGCPVCGGKVVIKGKNDLNTIHPELSNYLLNIEDGNIYSSGSHKKIKCKCPDCGYIKEIVIKNLVNQGFSCDRCHDNVSYPNKFIREMLRQLKGDNYIPEYHPEWSGGYRYDCYFKQNGKEYIIEMDGAFHYIDKAKWNSRSLKAQQEIDIEKNQLAEDNNVIIIRIDSRKSNTEYLRDNILKSELSTIFDLDNIDWDLCNKMGLCNYVKEACSFYEKNKYNFKIDELASQFGVTVQTFRNYIKQGLKYGWCTLSEYDKMMIKAKFNTNPQSKPIRVFKDGVLIKEYPSINNCAKDLSIKCGDKIFGSSISRSIKRNHGIYHGFFFKYV